MVRTVKMNLDDGAQLSLLAKALSAQTRIDILKQLRRKELSINEISEQLELPPSSAAAHVKVLEEAGLIKTALMPGIRGSMKVCSIQLDHIYVELNTELLADGDVELIRMPIGSYVDCQVGPTCGLAGLRGPIGKEDDPGSFYHPDRLEAKLIWFGSGYLEYRFPSGFLSGRDAVELEFSAELCSEDHEYNMDHPSDITLWINGHETGTFTCPGDLGGRRGRLNPDWWPDKNTQYGILKTWRITQDGCYLDGNRASELGIGDLGLKDGDYIAVRIGIKEDAANQGGMNLFGEGFGDYAQNLVMKFVGQKQYG